MSCMNRKIANALYGYFESLYNLNRNIITLCGASFAENYGRFESVVNDSVFAIPRLVPYAFDKSSMQYYIDKNDGLMEYAGEIDFLESDYNDILENHLDFLRKIKQIRNKLEHRMHAAELTSTGSGSILLFEFVYRVKDEEFYIRAGEMIRFTMQMNEMFSRIQELLQQYMYEEGKQYYVYYNRLVRYDFAYFNLVYKSDLIRKVGGMLLPF